MGRRRKKYQDTINVTPVAGKFIACLGGLVVLYYAESTMNDVQNSVDKHTQRLPSWQVHMGSICVSVLAFVAILFLLEFLRSRSKITAWHLAWPWLPLVGLTSLATLIHIPAYIVIPAGAIHGVWAYRRTSKER
jgi:hypothetical protein